MKIFKATEMFPIQYWGSGMFIPDPNFFLPGFGVKKIPGSHPGSRGQKGTQTRIPNRNNGFLSSAWKKIILNLCSFNEKFIFLSTGDQGPRSTLWIISQKPMIAMTGKLLQGNFYLPVPLCRCWRINPPAPHLSRPPLFHHHCTFYHCCGSGSGILCPWFGIRSMLFAG